MPIPTQLPADLSEQIAALLASLPTPETIQAGTPSEPLPSNLASIIDHTLLAPNATTTQIRAIVKEANELQAGTYCINAGMLPVAVQESHKIAQGQQQHRAKPICVVSFPFGAGSTKAKADETVQAVRDGAEEIDMVQNVGFVRSQLWQEVWEDVNAVVRAAGEGVPVKVILETAYLTWEEIAISTLISCLAGAAFVKTSTGYASAGAQPEHIKLMSHIATPLGVKVKASGGIRDLAKVKLMWECGARRVGASGTKAILEEYNTGAKATDIKESGY